MSRQDAPRLLKVKEVAVYLGIGYQAVLDLIHDGQLPTVCVPGRRSYRIDSQDVEAMISAWKGGYDIEIVNSTIGLLTKEVGIKVGINDEKQPTKTNENTRPRKHPKP